MRAVWTNDANCGFGRLLELARAEPVAVTKYGGFVAVMMAVEEFQRLKELVMHALAPASAGKRRASA